MSDLEEQINALLQAKYAHDQRWGFNGPLIVRALFQPGCAVCRACADRGDRELSFLLHEHINDAPVVVRLIESNGFCRGHTVRARRHVAQTYEDQLKIVLLYDHFVHSLDRRLGEEPAGLAALRPRRDCPICEVERAAESEVVDWLIEGLEVPEIRSLYTAGAGLCVRHLLAAWARAPRFASVLAQPVRAALDAARRVPDGAQLVLGTIGDRVALIWSGGWGRDQIVGAAPGCPICQGASGAEQRALRAVAVGQVDGLPCHRHVRALRAILAGTEWPGQIISAMVARADTLTTAENRRLPTPLDRLRALVHGEEQEARAVGDPAPCPVCREARAAVDRVLSEVAAADLAETGCLAHIAELGRWQPASEPTSRAVLLLRLRRLAAAVVDACRFDRVPRKEHGTEFTTLADQLTSLFGYYRG